MCERHAFPRRAFCGACGTGAGLEPVGVSNAVTAHVLRAMRLGATKQEILEAVETSIIPGGAPAFFNGLSGILKAIDAAKQ